MIKLDVDNSRSNVHTYTIDWQPDQLSWGVDGKILRTIKKSDTYNSTDNTYHYPQSPSKIQLSLWPAGLPSNGEGTITWAGGLVNWNSGYMQNGYYYAMVSEVQVECYNPPSGWNNNFGSKAYYYTSTAGTQDTVAIGNNNTVLSSFYASGDNPTFDPYAKAKSGDSTASAPPPEITAETVPGISGGGVRGTDGSTLNSGNNGASSSSGGDAGNSGENSNIQGGGITSFYQNGGAQASTNEAAPKLVSGSAVALLGFFVAALML
jgi:beta-glucanase (GH16 family)